MGILNKACCCCQLTTAAVQLGWLGAIGYFMIITGLIIAISSGNVTHLAVTCTGLLVSLVNMIGCSCLIAGAIKKVRHLIVPWLIGEIIYIIFVAFCSGAYLFEFLKYQLSAAGCMYIVLCYIKMGILNKAFCCCQLTTAAVLLGWLGAIGYLSAIAGLIVTVLESQFFKANEFIDVVEIAVIYIGLLISMVNLIGCGCLMAGTIKKIRHLFVPWLIGQIIFIIFVAFCCGAYFFILLKYQHSTHFFLSLVYLLFQIYVWVCVYSLYQELRDQDNKKLGVETKKSTTLKDDPQPYSSLA